MALLLVLAAVVVSLAVVLWTLLPLRGDAAPLEAVDPRFVRLLAEREAALTELRDLDADHADGRLADDDWQPLRAEAVDRAARALAALDALAAHRDADVAAAAAWLDGHAAGDGSGEGVEPRR